MAQVRRTTDPGAATLQYRAVWLAVGWLWLAVIVYLSLTPDPPDTGSLVAGDKLGHLLAYGILMSWFCLIYLSAWTRTRLAAAFVLLGIVLEVVQGLEGFRTFDYYDMLANIIGVCTGWLLGQTQMQYALRRMDRLIAARSGG